MFMSLERKTRFEERLDFALAETSRNFRYMAYGHTDILDPRSTSPSELDIVKALVSTPITFAYSLIAGEAVRNYCPSFQDVKEKLRVGEKPVNLNVAERELGIEE